MLNVAEVDVADRMEKLTMIEKDERRAKISSPRVIKELTCFNDLADNKKRLTVDGVQLNVRITADGKVTINGAAIKRYDSFWIKQGMTLEELF